MSKLQVLKPGVFVIPKEKAMFVDGLIIATDSLLAMSGFEECIQQIKNVAQLPGIVGYSIAMPDMHWGYGFPIGGVAAMDVEQGVISPGGVGYDINCGVRLCICPIPFQQISKIQRENLLQKIYALVPSGVGHGHKNKKTLSNLDYQNIAYQGASWSIEQGFGYEQDLLHTESFGCLADAEIQYVSELAKQRGANQLGTIGSGNHFVEIGSIDTIFEPNLASAWKVSKGLTYILIHSGSRGFGHQICSDTLKEFNAAGFSNDLPDKQLTCAPIQSALGKKYFGAMGVAANYAFNNRQRIMQAVRQGFQEVLGIQKEDIFLVYDVCHNIAKIEEHMVYGKKKKLCVHRKGATRAFAKGHPELPDIYQATGQPVIVPGDMQRASYLLVGKGSELTWSSCCHGAGRAKSRSESMKIWHGKDVKEHMRQKGVHVIASSLQTVAEEMPDAYKDVHLVIESVQLSGLADPIAKLTPQLVIKG